MEEPEVVLFDLDGTLLDNATVVIEAYYTGLQHLEYSDIKRDQIAAQAGKDTFETGRALGIEEEDLEELDAWFWRYFEKYCKTTTDPIPVISGVYKTLNLLFSNNIALGIVTSNTAENASLLLKKAELDQVFSTIVGKQQTQQHKPHPAPIYYALEQINYRQGPVWFVGDTSSDVIAAKRAEVRSIAIPQPHSIAAVIDAEPDLLVDSMEVFYEMLLNDLSSIGDIEKQ